MYLNSPLPEGMGGCCFVDPIPARPPGHAWCKGESLWPAGVAPLARHNTEGGSKLPSVGLESSSIQSNDDLAIVLKAAAFDATDVASMVAGVANGGANISHDKERTSAARAGTSRSVNDSVSKAQATIDAARVKIEILQGVIGNERATIAKARAGIAEAEAINAPSLCRVVSADEFDENIGNEIIFEAKVKFYPFVDDFMYMCMLKVEKLYETGEHQLMLYDSESGVVRSSTVLTKGMPVVKKTQQSEEGKKPRYIVLTKAYVGTGKADMEEGPGDLRIETYSQEDYENLYNKLQNIIEKIV